MLSRMALLSLHLYHVWANFLTFCLFVCLERCGCGWEKCYGEICPWGEISWRSKWWEMLPKQFTYCAMYALFKDWDLSFCVKSLCFIVDVTFSMKQQEESMCSGGTYIWIPRILQHTYTRPGCLLPCPTTTVPPSPFPCYSALTLHLTLQAWTHLRHYDVAFCLQENREKSALTQHNGVHHCNVIYFKTYFFSLAFTWFFFFFFWLLVRMLIFMICIYTLLCFFYVKPL